MFKNEILKAIYPRIEKKKMEYLSLPFFQKRKANDKNNSVAAINDTVISELNFAVVIKANNRMNPTLLKKLLIIFLLSSSNSTFL